jgi:hypothetical protein
MARGRDGAPPMVFGLAAHFVGLASDRIESVGQTEHRLCISNGGGPNLAQRPQPMAGLARLHYDDPPQTSLWIGSGAGGLRGPGDSWAGLLTGSVFGAHTRGLRAKSEVTANEELANKVLQPSLTATGGHVSVSWLRVTRRVMRA